MQLNRSGFALGLAALTIALGVAPAALASPAPPSGLNIGFRFSGSSPSAPSADAIFLNSDGSSLTPCNGNIDAGCQFDFRYHINGTLDQSAPVADALVQTPGYDTWPTITDENRDGLFCWSGRTLENFGPLTNYNCFNENGFGQSFRPTVDGVLSDFTMATTCLSPTGSIDITALLFVTNETDQGPSLSGDPIATASVHLSDCAMDWSGHEFTDADFHYPEMDFGAVSLNASTVYSVVFSGDGVYGAQPTGAPTPEPTPTNAAPTLAATLASTGVNDGAALGSALAAVALGLLGLGLALGARTRRLAR